MDPLPFSAKRGQARLQFPRDARHLRPPEAIDLTQLDRSIRTVEIQHCFAFGADHMNMRRTMIVRVDHDAQSTERCNARHDENLTA